MGAAAELRSLLAASGVGFPRGVLGVEAVALARALAAGAPEAETERLALEVARAHWGDLRGAVGAGLRRAAERGDARDRELIERAAERAADPSPGSPLAMACARLAGESLAGALRRTAERLAVLEDRAGGRAAGDRGVMRTVGDILVDLLDLDVEDFATEIASYVSAGAGETAAEALARDAWDPEVRGWAAEVLATIDFPTSPGASAALRELATLPPSDDPAEDPLWTAVIISLAAEAVELAEAELTSRQVRPGLPPTRREPPD